MWHKVDRDVKYTKITAATSYYSWAKLVYIIHVLFNLNDSKKLKYINWISFHILDQVLPLPTLNFRCVTFSRTSSDNKKNSLLHLLSVFTLSFLFSPLKCELFLPSSCPVSPLDCFLCCSLFFSPHHSSVQTTISTSRVHFLLGTHALMRVRLLTWKETDIELELIPMSGKVVPTTFFLPKLRS